MDVFLNIFLPVSGCKNDGVGCIYGSNSLYDRSLYTLTNKNPDVFLPVVKIPCTHFKVIVKFLLNIYLLLNKRKKRGLDRYLLPNKKIKNIKHC